MTSKCSDTSKYNMNYSYLKLFGIKFSKISLRTPLATNCFSLKVCRSLLRNQSCFLFDLPFRLLVDPKTSKRGEKTSSSYDG